MDFKALRYFLAVAQEENITRAAAALNMSQPPLTSQIRNLEAELGTELFLRTKKGLQLTPTGRILYTRARQILELARSAREEISAADHELSGEMILGTVEGRAPFLLAGWILGFREEFPLVTCTLRSGGTEELLEQMNRNQLDLALIASPYNPEVWEGIVVDRQPWTAMIPAEHPLAADKKKTIRLADLDGQILITPERGSRIREMEEWFEEMKVTPRVAFKTSNYINALALVEQGAGICIFPRTAELENRRIVTRVITDPPRWAEYVLVKRKEAGLSEVAREFWDYMLDSMESVRLKGG